MQMPFLLRCRKFLSAAQAAPLRSLATSATANPTKDDYFAAINHISNIVRREVHPERTLNRLRIPITSELVFRVLRATSSFPIHSLRFFSWARSNPSYRPTSLEFEELVKILAKHKNFESMWKIIHHMNRAELTISAETLCFVIEQYGRHGFIDQAVEVFNKAAQLGSKQTVEVYNALLQALCEVKMFHGAYALIRRMIRKGVKPDKKTYAVLVHGWCSAGKMREAQEFLDEMSRKGFNPPVRGRDLLIEGLLNAGYLESAVSKVGRIDEAFRLLNNSIEDGHKPFPSLYAPVIKGMCRRGQLDDAFSFFSDMKEKGHPPNRPVYTMLITMCGRGGRFVDAANYLVEMTEVGLMPISRCFDMVTDGLKNCGKHDLAKRIEQLEVSLRGV